MSNITDFVKGTTQIDDFIPFSTHENRKIITTPSGEVFLRCGETSTAYSTYPNANRARSNPLPLVASDVISYGAALPQKPNAGCWDGTNLIVVGTQRNIYKYNATGTLVSTHTNVLLLNTQPKGICWDATTSSYYVIGARGGQQEIQKVSQDLSTVSVIISNIAGTISGWNSYGVCRSDTGTLWVASLGDNSCREFTTAGAITGNAFTVHVNTRGLEFVDGQVWQQTVNGLIYQWSPASGEQQELINRNAYIQGYIAWASFGGTADMLDIVYNPDDGLLYTLKGTNSYSTWRILRQGLPSTIGTNSGYDDGNKNPMYIRIK